MFSNVIVHIPFPRRSFVSQSSCEVSASLTDVGGVAVGATNNSPSQDYTHPDNQTTLSHVTTGFKPFTVYQFVFIGKISWVITKLEAMTVSI